MLRVDINCDMGEGFGNEDALMPYVSSANISCGYHAGDEQTMRHTIELAQKNNVAIGAHPSFFDKANFGRTEMHLPTDQIYDLVFLQLRTIDKLIKQSDAQLHHVKPHGALYNMSARDPVIAQAIARAVKDFDDELVLFGLSGSNSIEQAKLLNLKVANEVFADRTYQDDGSLTPRSQVGAMINSADECLRQALQMVREKNITSVNQKKLRIVADTICIHGDGKHAVEFAKTIFFGFQKEGITIAAVR